MKYIFIFKNFLNMHLLIWYMKNMWKIVLVPIINIYMYLKAKKKNQNQISLLDFLVW